MERKIDFKRQEKEKKHYNKPGNATTYESEVFPKYKQLYPFLINKINDLILSHKNDQLTVLEIGCADGLITRRIRCPSDKECTVIGMDLSENMIEEAKRRLKELKMEENMKMSFEVGDGYFTEIEPASVDIVILSRVIDIVEKPECVLTEIKRILKEDGVVVSATDCHKEKCLTWKYQFIETSTQLMTKYGFFSYWNMYSIKELKKFFVENGFRILESDKIHVDPTILYALIAPAPTKIEKETSPDTD